MRKIYCDGAAEPTNPGPTGHGVFIPDQLAIAVPGGHGTNQQAELRALIEALKLAEPGDAIFTDSQYAIGMIAGGWNAQKNIELVAEGRELYRSKQGVEIRWIRGHNGHQHQETADALATHAALTQSAITGRPVDEVLLFLAERSQGDESRLPDLLRQAERIALERADGHLTIMRFTTGWKVMLGTPDLDSGAGRKEVGQLKSFESLGQALEELTEP